MIKTSKRQSWRTYVSKINSRTSIKKVWSMVRKIAGKLPSCNIKHLNMNNTKIKKYPILPTLLARLSQITHLPTTIALNSRLTEITLKTRTSNLNPIIWRRIIIPSLLMNSGMPSQNHTTVRLARMTSTTRWMVMIHDVCICSTNNDPSCTLSEPQNSYRITRINEEDVVT